MRGTLIKFSDTFSHPYSCNSHKVYHKITVMEMTTFYIAIKLTI